MFEAPRDRLSVGGESCGERPPGSLSHVAAPAENSRAAGTSDYGRRGQTVSRDSFFIQATTSEYYLGHREARPFLTGLLRLTLGMWCYFLRLLRLTSFSASKSMPL